MKLLFKSYRGYVFSLLVTVFLSLGFFVYAQVLDGTQPAQDISSNARVDTTSAGFMVRVAPGDPLPIAVKLLNFGAGKKVDVMVTYEIFNSSGQQIYTTTDTVAVETTASFIKTVQIPLGASPGGYVAKSSIIYQDQLVPASTQFSFIVENKFFGLFESDFWRYIGIIAFVSIFMVLLVYLFIRRRIPASLVSLDYSDIPKEKRVFFELLSDTIMQMRLRVGDSALDVATHINGLKIDERTGRVLELTESPSKVIALLVSGYEKVLGRKVSFSFRNPY